MKKSLLIFSLFFFGCEDPSSNCNASYEMLIKEETRDLNNKADRKCALITKGVNANKECIDNMIYQLQGFPWDGNGYTTTVWVFDSLAPDTFYKGWSRKYADYCIMSYTRMSDGKVLMDYNPYGTKKYKAFEVFNK